jgi:hypothetical protein
MAPKVVVGAISSFVLARNRYASGYLAMPLGALHFACQSHIDLKRSLSRFGSIVGDTMSDLTLRPLANATVANTSWQYGSSSSSRIVSALSSGSLKA